MSATLQTRRWLSQQEAADYLGVSDRTIREYIRRGAITGRRLPGSRLIRLDRHEIDNALARVPSADCGEPALRHENDDQVATPTTEDAEDTRSRRHNGHVVQLFPRLKILDAYLGLNDALRYLEQVQSDLPQQAVAAAASADELRPGETAASEPDAARAAAMAAIGAVAPLLAHLDNTERARVASRILRPSGEVAADGS